MALANGVRFIWLDEHIGKEEEYHDFKQRFNGALEPTTAVPPDSIDVLIRAFNENAAPFLFADTAEKAIDLIQVHHDKKIIFISSGSLGKHIIPLINTTYPQVHSFYFFCAVIENYVDFAYDYASCLQIFNYELDLLVRLARDISKDIITQGKTYMNFNDPKCALKCFQHAQTLNITANTVDTLNSPFLGHLRELESREGYVGLIQQAENMLNQEQQQPTADNTQNQQQQQQPPGENEEDDPVSQEETHRS